MKIKFDLNNLKVKSFITQNSRLDSETVKGGINQSNAYICTGACSKNPVYCRTKTCTTTVTEPDSANPHACDQNTVGGNC